jgi:Ankyrin repeats (many copies)
MSARWLRPLDPASRENEPMTVSSDASLRKFVDAIVTGEEAAVKMMLVASPELATAVFCEGATRRSARENFIESVGRYVVAGDTAFHFAAAGYREAMVRLLMAAGADVCAKNRHGAMPLHAAAAGNPGSQRWNPLAQEATIRCLLAAGADPNGADKRGVAPLHIAVRTRCAAAVRTLLACGADAERPNRSGSTALTLARLTTGRGGSGSVEAKEQQGEIIELLTTHKQP